MDTAAGQCGTFAAPCDSPGHHPAPASSQRRATRLRKGSYGHELWGSDMAADSPPTQASVPAPPSGPGPGSADAALCTSPRCRSVRSTYWTLLVLLARHIWIGAAIFAISTAANCDHTSAPTVPPSTRHHFMQSRLFKPRASRHPWVFVANRAHS